MKKNITVFLFMIMLSFFLILWVFQSFKITEKKNTQDLSVYLLNEVKSFTVNMQNYIDKNYGDDLYNILKENVKKRKKLNLYLRSFITLKFRNVFIVYKRKNEKFFRVLADGSKDIKDRFLFNEKFEPLEYTYWRQVLQTKKTVYFKQKISNIWATFLYPVVINNRIKYIIVIDFSTVPIKLIKNNLNFLKSNLKIYISAMVLVIIMLLYVVYYDYHRQIKMEKLINQLKHLNDTLEERVQEEIDKNIEKDKQLILQSRMALMGELLSMIAHQWRQPLNVIGLIISNIKLKIRFNQLEKDFLDESCAKIENVVKHLSVTIDEFRKFYRNEPEKRMVTLEEIVKGTLNIAKSSLDNNNIKIIQKLQCNKKLNTYPNELKQVLLNIIRNAEDILKERKIKNPCIIIKAFYESAKCIIEIEDNGGGIDFDILQKIFNPYFTTKNERNGTGLGLYMSKQIIEERLKGKLFAINENEGAVFRIELKVEYE